MISFRLNRSVFAAVLFFVAVNVFANVSFSSLNINGYDEVLFALNHKTPTSIEYSTIFKTRIRNGVAEYFPNALTCFPEHLQAFDSGKKLHIKNLYGNAVYDFDSATLVWTERADSFPENFSSSMPVALSDTGKWYCTLERTDTFKGRLVVTETATGKRIVLNENCVFSYSVVPVKWAPHGENFVYEKNGAVYLCNPEKLFKDVLIQETFRKVCSGTINSVEWKDDGKIIYISSDLVFRIEVKDIDSLGLYAQYVPLGKSVARLPQKFDSASDKFWINKTASDFFVTHRGETLYWYKTNSNPQGAEFVKTIYSAPFMEQNMTPLEFNAFWTSNGELGFVVKLVSSGTGTECYGIYTISLDGKRKRRFFVKDAYGKISISPDSNHIAFFSENKLFVYNTDSWKTEFQSQGETAVSFTWRNSENLCIGGIYSVKNVCLNGLSENPLFASSANSAWWIGEKEIAFKDKAKNTYKLSEKNNFWKQDDLQEKEASIQNNEYRVFCGTTKNSLYENAVYVRTLSGRITTRPLVEQTAVQRLPCKKVVLVFDADEDYTGLNPILAICNEYKIKGTFFFNGEFVRRYPVETKKIAESGHECAAIFYNNIDLTNQDVYNDKRFVSKGLARLEDEFFACTKKELSLYWHAPYHKADKKICEEGSTAGYAYVDFNKPYIIPFIATASAKLLSNTVLYEKIDLLVNELLSNGAEIVTISKLAN